MGEIRELVDEGSEWYLPKEARTTAVHYARQYKEWKAQYSNLTEDDPRRKKLEERMKLIEDTAKETDDGAGLYNWLLQCVIQKTSYAYMNQKLGMPCGEEKYHKMKREFFYRLSEKI